VRHAHRELVGFDLLVANKNPPRRW
jgi:hypothetical protein